MKPTSQWVPEKSAKKSPWRSPTSTRSQGRSPSVGRREESDSMPQPKPQILLCTVGTSLFKPNLDGLVRDLDAGKLADPALADLAAAHKARDWNAVADALDRLPADQRTCGAEVNSVASMIALGHVPADVGLVFFHSATDDG